MPTQLSELCAKKRIRIPSYYTFYLKYCPKSAREVETTALIHMDHLIPSICICICISTLVLRSARREGVGS